MPTSSAEIILKILFVAVAIWIWISQFNRNRRQRRRQQQQQGQGQPSKEAAVIVRRASKSSGNNLDGRVTACILQQVKRLPSFVLKTAKSSIVRILEIFPNTDIDLIKGLLLDRKFNVEMVVGILIDMNDQQDKHQTNHWRWLESRYHHYMPLQRQDQEQQSGTKTALECPLLERQKEEEKEAELLRHTMQSMWATFGFMSVDEQPSFRYKSSAAHQLLRDFPFLNFTGANRVLRLSNNHYAPAHDKLLRAIKGAEARVVEEEVHNATNNNSNTNDGELSLAEIDQYRRVVQAMTQGHALDEDQIARVVATMTDNGNQELAENVRRTCLRGERDYIPTPPTPNDILLEETAYVQHKLTSWATSFENKLHRKLCQLREEPLVQCGCCYDEYPTSEMVACAVGHVFCTACLVSFVENQMFGCGNLGIDPDTKKPLLQLRCFHPVVNCQSGFHRTVLESTLSTATLRHHDEIQSSLNVAAAELTDLCSCPKCGYQAIVPGSSSSSSSSSNGKGKDKDRSTSMVVFDCPVEDCRYKTCVKCGEHAHDKMTCQEAAEDPLSKDGRLQVEEAMTAAKVRRCPKCNKAIIKLNGCNMVLCACGNSLCYICRESIDSHSHFFGGSCKLFTNDQDADDIDAMRRAGAKAAEEFVKNNKSVTTDIKKKIVVDTEALLQNNASASKNSWAWPWSTASGL